jgi:hypothetical protein
MMKQIMVVKAKYSSTTTYVGERYYSSKDYSFLTTLKTLRKNDMVIVKDRYGLAIVKVVSKPVAFDYADSDINAWVVSKVNESSVLLNQEVLDEVRRLRKEMDQRIKEFKQESLYETYADVDPRLAKIFKRYKLLTNMI